MSLVIFVDHLKYHRQRDVDADRFAVDLLKNEELPDYKVVLAIALLPVSYTLRVLVRQLQCQVCIDYDFATDLTDCRTDPFAVLDSPRCGRAAAEEGLYSFEAIDQVLLLRRHLLLVHCLCFCTVTIALLPHSCLLIITDFNKFHIIKAMSIRELTWQIKQVVLEAQNFTSILPSLRIFSLKTYEISDL